MSCYGWERGKVKIPTNQWKTTKTKIINQYNYSLNQEFEKATAIYEKIKEETKGKRKVDYVSLVQQAVYTKNNNSSINSYFGFGSLSSYYSGHFFNELKENSLINRKTKKLKKPKKSDFPFAKPTETHLRDDDLDVSFDNKSKEVIYSTDDNNHSIDSAEESVLGKITISTLSRVSYTNRTGGYLKSFTEYQRDDGTGANVSKVFGVSTYKEKIIRGNY